MPGSIISIDPLSPVANYNLGETLWAIGQTGQARDYLTVAYNLEDGFAKWFLPAINLIEGRDQEAVSQTEAELLEMGIEPAGWVAEMVTGARDPSRGEAWLSTRIEEVLQDIPEEFRYYWRNSLEHWHLYLGFMDRFYALIARYGPNLDKPTDADVYVWTGTVFHRQGFTAHPGYLEVAAALGIIDVWDRRGPPDFCNRHEDEWVCR